jgi:hypothetical protein
MHRRISFFQAPGIEVAVRSIDAPLKNFTPPSELKNALGRALIANDSTTASLSSVIALSELAQSMPVFQVMKVRAAIVGLKPKA